MQNNELEHVLRSTPCGLLTDIDGVISPIAATPDGARASAVAQQHLRRLAQSLEVVGAISGRGASDAAALVGLPELLYIGNHGMEEWQAGRAEPVPAAQPYIEVIATVLQAAEAQIKIPGVIFENKGVTASVHYRLAPEPERAGSEIGAVLQDLAAQHGVRVTGGRLVWELRPPLKINKGTALLRIIKQHKLKGALYLGDDRTDADAFAVLHELREHHQCATLAVGVVAAETPEIVRELADILVEGVSGVEQFLARAADLAELYRAA